MTNSYLGNTWWDNETDGNLMYPEPRRRKLSAGEVVAIQRRNPEGAALRGLWSDQKFLDNVTDLNPKLTRTQFADFHGHGWVFRNVYKQDRKGNLLDADERGGGRRRSRPLQEGRASEGHPPREGDALRGLPLQAGRPRQRQALRRDARGRSRSPVSDCHGTIRRPGESQDLGSGRAGRAARDLSLLTHAVRPAPLPVAQATR